MRALLCTAILIGAIAVAVLGQGPNEILNLPGAPANLGYRQYAGYVNVDPANNRQLFYWFVESQQSPSTDPLVLWLNGKTPFRTFRSCHFSRSCSSVDMFCLCRVT